jgi:acyl carrier protein
MQPDTTKIWTRAEIRVNVGKILVESLGVDEATVTDQAALVRDLGAESIDFLDISFKCQQTFGVDLPARLIQDRLIEWRDLAVLAKVVEGRYRVTVTPEELRTIAPATVSAVLQHLGNKHGVERAAGDESALASSLAERLIAELDGMGLDLSDLSPAGLAAHLLENLHSPVAVEEVMNRFTVRALADYIAGQLGAVARLAAGA